MPDMVTVALIAAGSALLGALIGAISPIVVGVINARETRRQERSRLTVQLALADHASRIDLLTGNHLPPGQRVVPLALYVDYHSRVLEALDRGPLTPEAMEKLHADHRLVKERLDAQPGYPIPPAPKG